MFLLEDINLQGAKGILVNITGGTDLAIGEFDEVGNTVKEFASDEAVVVVGTVIDPDLREEIRVTVVATGLGAQMGVSEPTIRLVQKPNAASAFEHPDKASEIRQKRVEVKRTGTDNHKPVDLDYLDIPAFLRRQAD